MQHYFLAAEPESDGEPGTDPSTGSAAPRSHAAPVQKFSVAGEDPEQARQILTEAYDGARFVVTRGEERFSFRFASVGDDRVTLRTATIAGHVSGEVPRLDEYVVTWFQSGGGRIQRRDAAPVDLPNAPFLLPFEQRYTFTLTPHRQNSVHFASSFLEDIATEIHAGARQTVSFDSGTMPSAALTDAWRTTVAEAAEVLVDVDASPLLRLNAQGSLARALLGLFPWVAFDVPKVLREPSLARTRLALEFLHHHAHEPITPADAARAAGLHTRTLQHHLSRHLDTSPTIYLRDIRLDRARADLAEASPDDTTVATIARSWGFGHLGRFSAAYRTRFGERPNETLRR